MDGGGWFDGDLNGDFEVKRCLSSFVDEGRIESHRYYLARRTLLEMLRDRGYSIPALDIDISLQDFRSFYSQKPDPDRLRISAALRSDPSKKILVIFCGPDVVKVNAIRSIATQIVNKDSLSKLILVLQNHITSQALKAVDLFSFQVEKFQLPRMLQQDAIARYYGLEKGQVVKVIYNGEITGSHVTYRCVW
ncbi:DNA-directed RNA polymerase V subunit 5A isoform X2 [Vitis vinifera]|uniref:DNA-directed RNA polymerase V subunit 5A isoform X2 n=1 Tax=Vitis vinifera TaxID=29760 RepID=UPI0008FFCE55|nr:DNA-directed RNA polymerase V subunit 5A isoform X2 [Vitis vinifera]|eukprot:XP_019077235.1 PREDICTED: DNA-directed RNA polymerase V subunit 5A isoform X2 [Vitis vinifera]